MVYFSPIIPIFDPMVHMLCGPQSDVDFRGGPKTSACECFFSMGFILGCNLVRMRSSDPSWEAGLGSSACICTAKGQGRVGNVMLMYVFVPMKATCSHVMGGYYCIWDYWLLVHDDWDRWDDAIMASCGLKYMVLVTLALPLFEKKKKTFKKYVHILKINFFKHLSLYPIFLSQVEFSETPLDYDPCVQSICD